MQVSSWLPPVGCSLTAMEKKILVYNDVGANEQSAKELLQTSQELLPERKIEFVDSKTLQTTNWADTTDALFMGGGEASLMEEGLGPDGLKKIFSAVHEKNVAVFATCASAYLFSKERTFAYSKKGVIRSQCPLFDGSAWGPALPGNPYVHYLHESAAKAANIQLQDCKTEGLSYYLAGPTFKGKFELLASYMDNGYPEPAVIQVGKRVVFSGIHPEFKWKQEMETALAQKHFAALVPKLVRFEEFRKTICLKVFQALNLLKKA